MCANLYKGPWVISKMHNSDYEVAYTASIDLRVVSLREDVFIW